MVQTPTASGTKYTSAITISSNTTINAIAIDNAGNKSTVVSKSYLTQATSITVKFKALPIGLLVICGFGIRLQKQIAIAGGTAWPGNAKMTLGTDGYYSYTIPNVAVVEIGIAVQ